MGACVAAQEEGCGCFPRKKFSPLVSDSLNSARTVRALGNEKDLAKLFTQEVSIWRSVPTLPEPLLLAVPIGFIRYLLRVIIVAGATTIVTSGGILVQVKQFTQSATTSWGTSAQPSMWRLLRPTAVRQ